jgi:lipoate-protein ligase A
MNDTQGVKKSNFREELQRQIKMKNSRDFILQQIEKTPNIIYQLSNERLDQLKKLYDEKIEELEKDILSN